LARTSVGDVVYDRILLAIQEGRLLPGERLNDLALAGELDVSRAPVRDALQRLRVIGVVETVAGHYTRVAVVERAQTIQALGVWVALYRLVVAEVVPSVSDDTVASMREAHERFAKYIEPFDGQGMAAANAEFFAALSSLANPDLGRAIAAVVHVVRLGALNLPARLDVRSLFTAQESILRAVAARDVDSALEMLDLIGALSIPT
jgi:DNA-binding GntR family transcriptional regulator